MRDKLNKLLEPAVHEQHIVLKSESIDLKFTLTPLTQLSLGAGAAVLAGWLAVSTTAFFMNQQAERDFDRQTILLTEAYENRIAVLQEQLDYEAAVTEQSHERLELALSELSIQQSELLSSLEQTRELQAGLGQMRQKLQIAIDERDLAQTEAEGLEVELAQLSGDLNVSLGSEKDQADTLALMTGALGEAVEMRDTALQGQEEMSAELAALELRMQINAERQDRMVGQLEEAVALSFQPLEQMFAASGMDVDNLVNSIRANYSGVGGPLMPETLAAQAFEDPLLSERFAQLLTDLDRMNMMRIAAVKIPYSMPVKAAHRFTSGFGGRRDPKTGGYRQHNGIDLAGPIGTPVLASGEGVVVHAGRQSGFGNLIKISHGFGLESSYAHLSKIHVSVGDKVSLGDHIGDMGNTGRTTGPHLHYEIRSGGIPVNPMTYIRAARNVF